MYVHVRHNNAEHELWLHVHQWPDVPKKTKTQMTQKNTFISIEIIRFKRQCNKMIVNEEATEK